MRRGLLSMSALGAIFLAISHGKPTEITDKSITLDPVASTADTINNDAARKERSPQFGLLDDYSDYSDYDEAPRHLHFGHKRKFHKPHRKPFGFVGGHGCRGYGCGGGWRPDYGYYNGQAGQGGTFASATAGSLGGGVGPYGGGGHSQANAQSATFSFGPYSATFSVAQASSARKAI